ncbi:MATE family efflux transporter, partial [Vibrio parahaemolyticus]|nr:MATE family efflux transporter [Vibrio parahaemolyticus]
VGYIGWNFYGNIAAVVSNYGVNILLNITFGTVVNAARAIAMQVNSAVFGFVSSLQTSFAPQIIKSYSGRDTKYVRSLIFSGAKISFFLLLFISMPILVQTDYILKLWLGNVPENTEKFVKLVVIDSLIISLSGVIMTTFQATGKIKLYQIVVGTVILLNLPVSYLALKLGGAPSIVYYVAISISLIALV